MSVAKTHQVPKLDGGESGLDDGPQAPKEVGCQGKPVFKHTGGGVIAFSQRPFTASCGCCLVLTAHLLTST